MKDVQSERDERQLEIDKVGIRNIRYPISVLDKAYQAQHTVADINLYVHLPEHFRGTHMSRFIEILNRYQREIDINKIDELLEEGYNPILDDGVGKNIAPLQNKGIIPYEVLNKGQLKKYLNADW